MQVSSSVAPPFTATLPGDVLSVDPEVVAAAQQGQCRLSSQHVEKECTNDIEPVCTGLSDLATSAVAWSEAAMSLAGPQAANLQALASLAADRLASVEAIDSASFLSLQSSMESLLSGLKNLMDQEAGEQAGQLTNALVLGVQQLVAMSRLEESGGAYSVDAMAEAQAAFEEVAKVGGGNLKNHIIVVLSNCC